MEPSLTEKMRITTIEATEEEKSTQRVMEIVQSIIPTLRQKSVGTLWQKLEEFLDIAESNHFIVTDHWRLREEVWDGMAMLSNRTEELYPPCYAKRAQALWDSWDMDEITAGYFSKQTEEDDDEGSPSDQENEAEDDAEINMDRKPGNTKIPKGDTTVRQPPEDHPIYGKDGILCGMAVKGRLGKVDDQRYESINAMEFGHNDLPVGHWMAYRKTAKYCGAHGTEMSGILGNGKDGAYSIVVAGKIDGKPNKYDPDLGDILYYSGTEAHNKRGKGTEADPLPPRSTGTEALERSRLTQKSVRVIRKADASQYAPDVGFRYDGLYKVMGVENFRNAEGYLYERFRLVRDEGQPSLLSIQHSRPSKKERKAYAEIENVDTSEWGVVG